MAKLRKAQHKMPARVRKTRCISLEVPEIVQNMVPRLQRSHVLMVSRPPRCAQVLRPALVAGVLLAGAGQSDPPPVSLSDGSLESVCDVSVPAVPLLSSQMWVEARYLLESPGLRRSLLHRGPDALEADLCSMKSRCPY